MSQPNSELSNFSLFLQQEVIDSLALVGEGGFREAAFTQLIMEYLVDANETANVNVCTAVHRNKSGSRLRQVNGYGIWDNYETLDIFIADYRGNGEVYNLETNKVAGSIKLVLKYFHYLLKGDFGMTEDSAAEKELHQNFESIRESILRVRLILLTDGIVRKGIKSDKFSANGITVTTEIWDLERIFQIWSSQRKREPIEIDIPEQFGQRVRVLSIEQSKEEYITYLGIVPAQLLADLYDAYGSRLLEKNVRVYLQKIGRINKEMRRTILDTPGMFMAYNNGISVTATEVTTTRDKQSGFEILKRIKDFQIVNGGQTTSSIYYARKRDRADLSQIHVQMKITLVQNSKRMENVVSRISKYANSQNKVSEIDLTSNQSFHITLEELSRTTWASPVVGHQQTRWYYERVKGQYKEEVNKAHTASRKNAFKVRNPPRQVIRKEEFAKFRNTWQQLPYLVARGSQKNYLSFIETYGDVQPTRLYFLDTIAIAILFREGERIYGKKPDAMGDLRYLVVPYALAWLNYHTMEKMNLGEIWRQQVVPEKLRIAIKNILIRVNQFLQKEKPNKYALISEWAKREECWLSLRKYTPKDWDIRMETFEDLLNKTNRETYRNSVQTSTYPVLSVSIGEWELVERFGRETKKLTLIQVGTVGSIISRLKKQRPLTEQLIEKGEEVLKVYNSYKRS